MKKMMERFKNERGLTLVELLAVVVILAIIGTIAFVLIGNIIENSKKDAHIANAQQMISAAKLYEASGKEIGEDGINAKQLQDEEFLEPLVSPWKEVEDYGKDDKAKVTKSGSKYSVTFTGTGGKCDFSGKSEEEVLTEGRDICDKEP